MPCLGTGWVKPPPVLRLHLSLRKEFKNAPFATCRGLCARLHAALVPITGALAQSNSVYRSADAVAGKSERLGVYGNVQKDCTPGPLPTVRVVTPPSMAS